MNIELDLMNVGFTQNEARTYLALLELGESKSGKLCNYLKIASSHIYRILDSLIQKGVVSVKLSNNMKIFKANNPNTLNEIFVKKQNELEQQKVNIQNVIINLKKLPKQKETFSDYKYFEGVSGIRAMWLEIDELLVENSVAEIYISTVESWKQFNAFYLEHHKKRVLKNVKLRMIIPKMSKVALFAKQRKEIGLIEIRYIDSDNQAEFGIYGDLLMLQDTSKSTKNPRSFLIKDVIFAKTFEGIFDYLWVLAKKRM